MHSEKKSGRDAGELSGIGQVDCVRALRIAT
jgi:hypothetical protein